MDQKTFASELIDVFLLEKKITNIFPVKIKKGSLVKGFAIEM